MKDKHRTTFLAFAVMLTAALFAACSDGMTGPELEAPASVQSNTGSTSGIGDATTQSTCSADPAEGCYIIGGCNLADAFQTCHEQGGGGYGGGSGGGGTGGSGGGGGGGGSTGDSGDASAPSSFSNDFAPDTIMPNCASPSSTMETAVCKAKTPESGTVRRQRTEDALRRIQARGGACAAIAQRGWELLGGERLGYFPWQTGFAGGYGSPGFGAVLQEDWVDRFHDQRDMDGRNLDFALAHEIEHQMGRHHTNGQHYGNTPNDAACS